MSALGKSLALRLHLGFGDCSSAPTVDFSCFFFLFPAQTLKIPTFWDTTSFLDPKMAKHVENTNVLGVWEVYGRCMGGVWEVSGRCMGGVWEVYGRCMGGVWEEVYGRRMGGVWEVYGRCMGEVYGRRMGDPNL